MAQVLVWFDRIKRILLPVLAVIVILMAVLVGAARLLLPQVPQYRDDIQRIAEQATGFAVEFGEVSAGMSLHGPELRLQQTRISVPGDPDDFLSAEGIAISLDLGALIFSQQIVPGRTEVNGVAIDLVRREDGSIAIQGRLLAEWLELRGGDEPLDLDKLPDTKLWLRNVLLTVTDEMLQREPTEFLISELLTELDDGALLFDGRVEPEERFGRDIGLFAEIPLKPLLDENISNRSAVWTIEIDVPDLDISEWIALLPDGQSPVTSGKGSGVVSGTLRGGIPLKVGADIDLNNVELNNGEQQFERITGRFEFAGDASEWRFSARGLAIETGVSVWPSGNVDVRLSPGEKDDSRRIEVEASYLRLDDLSPLVRGLAGEILDNAGFSGRMNGEVRDLRLAATLVSNKPEILNIDAGFEELGYADDVRGIDVQGLNGKVSSNDSEGRLELAVRDQALRFEPMFREPIPVETLDGLLVWRAGEQGITLIGNGIEMQSPFGRGSASLQLEFPFDSDAGPAIDLTADTDVDDLTQLLPILPKIIPPKVITWLDGAIAGGRSENATFRLKGNLKEFPFEPGESGVFVIAVPFEDARLEYAPGWPALEEAAGVLVFDGVSMYSTENSGLFAGTRFAGLDARMVDLRSGELTIAGDIDTGVPEVLRFLRESTLSKALGTVLPDVEGSGRVTGDFDLLLPVKNLNDWRFDSSLTVANGVAGLKGLDFDISEVSGNITVKNVHLTSDDLRGRIFGEPVAITLRPPKENEQQWSQLAFLESESPLPELAEAFRLPFKERLGGTVAWNAEAQFPSRSFDDKSYFKLVIDTELESASIDLPPPVNKRVGEPDPARIIVEFPQPGSFIVGAELERGLSTKLRIDKINDLWQVERGVVHLGDRRVELPDAPGVEVTGRISNLLLSDWIQFGVAEEEVEGERSWDETFREFYIFASDLDVLGFSFPESRIRAYQIQDVWSVDVEGPRATGRLSIPNDFGGERPLMLDMSVLSLQDSPAEDTDEEPTDPRGLPRMLARVQDFSLLDMNFGYLEADIRKTEAGLETRRVQAENPSFTMTLEGDWLVTEPDAELLADDSESASLQHRSRVKFNLDSTNVADTLLRFGYDPLIEAEMGNANADVTWNGPPGAGVIYDSRGNVGFRVEEGQVQDVDPGGGRLLGLMSITSLPRRLSLDFRDVFDDGLGFDKLKGSFKLKEGIAHTCNVSLEGSVTDMVLIGRSDLNARTYDQLAVIRPHMSNVLPLGSAVLAGPAVGAAVLLVAAVFKDPLSNIGATYYSVSGSWDDPLIDQQEREAIDQAEFQDCESTLPELSAEDIAALQGLKNLQTNPAPVELSDDTNTEAAGDQTPADDTTSQEANPQGSAENQE